MLTVFRAPPPYPCRDGTSGSQTQMVEYSKRVKQGYMCFRLNHPCWNPRIFFAPRPHRFEPITSRALMHAAVFFYDLASALQRLQSEARWAFASEKWQEERGCLVKADGS